jgi:hypothetical protein
LKPTSQLTIEGGIRWVFWPPWYSQTNNIANFEPSAYNPAVAAVIDPKTGAVIGGSRYNGVVLPGNGFLGDAASSPLASDPQVLALFNGAPRGFSQMHYNAIEPRLGMSYALNEQTILRASGGVFHKSKDNASDKRDVVWDTYDDTNFYGPSTDDRRHVLSFYYIYDLPFWRQQDTMLHNMLGGWQISGSTSITPARRSAS